MDRGAWWATFHGVAKSRKQLATEHNRKMGPEYLTGGRHSIHVNVLFLLILKTKCLRLIDRYVYIDIYTYMDVVTYIHIIPSKNIIHSFQVYIGHLPKLTLFWAVDKSPILKNPHYILFLDYNGISIEINIRNILEKSWNIWKLNANLYIIPGTKKNEKGKLEIILNWIKIKNIKICTNQNLPAK